MFTAADQMFEVKGNEVTAMFQCNHKEADTRLVLHAILAEKVFKRPTSKWFFKYDASKYVDIESAWIFPGKDCHLHCLQFTDSQDMITSNFFGAGKDLTIAV